MQPGWDEGRRPLSAGESGGFTHPRELGAAGWVGGSFEIPQKSPPVLWRCSKTSPMGERSTPACHFWIPFSFHGRSRFCQRRWAVRDGHWGGAGGTVPSIEGKGPAEGDTEGSTAGSRHQPRPRCHPAKPGTTAAASCLAWPHPGQVTPTPQGWAARPQREAPERARGCLTSGNATAPGRGVWCKGREVAGSTSSSPRSAQRSPAPQLQGFGGVSACARGEQRGNGPARLSQSHITGAALFSRLCNKHGFPVYGIPGTEHRLQGN